MAWQPASQQDVERYLEAGLSACDPEDVARFNRMRVPLYQVEVASHPGESVFVVAAVGDRVLYYSDIEDGWELDALDSNGRLPERGASQFELSHIFSQLFSGPESP